MVMGIGSGELRNVVVVPCPYLPTVKYYQPLSYRCRLPKIEFHISLIS